MTVVLVIKMYFVLVLCPVLLAAGVQTLTIDSQLGTSIEDCFDRISIGEQIPLDAIYRNVSELTTRECEQICKQDKQCQAYDYGVGAKGNATCDLSNLSEKEIKEKNLLSRHPDYDVYVRRFQCEQPPPTPIQTQFDEVPGDGPEGPEQPERPERPSHRPVFRPGDDKFSDDYLVSSDLRPFTPGRPSPHRPDDYNNNKPDEDYPPSYGDLKPQDIPYRPERPTQNQSYNQRPGDELNFQGYGLAGKPQGFYGLEKPNYQYVTRPNRRPYQIQEGYRPNSDAYWPNYQGSSAGYGVNNNRPGPIGPSGPPHRPSRPYEKPGGERPGYYGQYASGYGQNSQTDNSIYVEIHDPPRPYRPVEKPYGLQGYGTYSSQNSYASNSQYSHGSITEIGGYDLNRPVDSHRPDPIRPDKPYGGESEGEAGYGIQKPSKPAKPYGESHVTSNTYGQNSGNHGSYNSGQGSQGYGNQNNYGSTEGYRPSYGSGGNKPIEQPEYGQKPQKPGRPEYGSQPYGTHHYGSQESYSSSQNHASNQESYNSHSYGSIRPPQDNYGQKPFKKPAPYPNNQDYGGSQGSYGGGQGSYGGSQSNYDGNEAAFGGSQGSYGGSQTSGSSQGPYGSSQSTYGGSQGSYGGSQSSYSGSGNSYGGTQTSGGNQGSYGGSKPAYGGSQSSYENTKPSYGSSQGSYGGGQSSTSGSYGSTQSSYGGSQALYGSSQSSNSYGGSRPNYSNSQNSYGGSHSSQGYGSQGSYGSSQSPYGGHQGSYSSDQGSYGGTQGSPGGNQASYGSSQGSYGDNHDSYGGSQSNYGGHQGSYGSTQASYTNTESSYGSSQSSISAQESYGSSQGSYGGSQGLYGSRPNHDKYRPKPSYGSDNYGSKPGYSERPTSNYGQKPGYDERPNTEYGQKPGFNDRPDDNYGQKPGYNERPVNGYGQKPSYNERPDNSYGQKPGYNERPDGSYGSNDDKPSYDRPINGSEYPGVKPVYEYELEKPGGAPSYLVGPGGDVVTSKPVVIGDYGERHDDPSREDTYKACFRRVLAGKRALRSHVRKVVDCERVEDCSRECASEIRFPCESFNYRLDRTFRGKGLCELMTKPIEAFDIRRDFVEDKDYDFYERDRNSLEPNCPDTLRGPGLLHSGFLSSKPGKGGEVDGLRDRNDWHTREYGYNRYDERRGSNNRRYEDRFFVPYQIGVGRSDDDQHNWGQYGGSYGNYNSYYKDTEDYHKSVNHWRLTNAVDRSYGVRPLENAIDQPVRRPVDSFDYQDLVKNPWGQRYGHGNWKRGRWNSSGESWNSVNNREYEKNKFEGRTEEGDGKDCSSRRRPGMSLSSGAIRRSLVAENVVECEAACFGEREFKCVSYSFRYSNARGSDNCFLSERPYRGLELSADSGSDVYAMPQDHGCVTINYRPWVESECFWHVRSGAAVGGAAARGALTVAGLGACEAECIRATGFFCRGFSFRFDSPTIGDELENCILTSSPPTSLETGHGLRPTSGHELYARGNYGRGCEPALYDDTQHKDSKCYLQYDSAARLTSAAARGRARVLDERACGAACTDAPFRCLSYSYSNNAAPDADNCFLSEIRLFDLQRGVDYVHSLDDWLFAFDLFNGQCWRKVHGKGEYEEPSPELPHPIAVSGPDDTFQSGPSGPGYLPEPPDPPYIPASGPPSGPDFKPYPPGPNPPIFKPGYSGASGPGYKPYPSEPSGPGDRPYEPSGPGFKPAYPPGFKPSYPPAPSGPGLKPGYSSPSGPSGPVGPSGPIGPSGHLGPIGPSGPLSPSGPGYEPGDFKPAFRPPPDSFNSGHRHSFKPGYSEKPGYVDRPGVRPGRPGPQKPMYHGDRGDNEITVSWRHYTVSGFPCRAGTSCAQNQVAGHWACEPEGGEIGSWDYCCAPSHRCGYSEGFHKPWCYVGPTEDQWRPCSEKYYPYHQHNVPHPSQGHREERPPQTRPWPRPSGPGFNQARPQGPYLSDADRMYWDQLYQNGPRAYYDKYGNPLPGYTRVPTEDRPYIKYTHNLPHPGGGHWVPVNTGEPDYGSSVPGGLGAPRYWPVAYLHKGPPPNMTYFRYNETTTTTEKTPLSRELPDEIDVDKPKNIDKHRDEKKRNISDFDRDVFITEEKTTVKTVTTEVPIVTENDTKKLNLSEIATPQGFKFTKVDTIDGIDDKLDDFSRSIEVLDLEDANKDDKKADLKTLEAEEKQIEEIGRLLASRRGGKLILEKRSQKNLEAKSIAVDEDLVDFNFGNRFPTTERRGIIQKVSKDEIERDKNTDRSLELSETTFVRPPRVLSTTDNIRKAIVNGKVFYDATIREQRDTFPNSTRKSKSLRPLEDRAPSVVTQAGFGKKKVVRARNVNPVRRVRRVYRKKYNPEEVRRRLLERERSKENNTDTTKKV